MRISDWSSDVCSSDRQREHLFALYAFNHEVAKTAEVVSEPLIGRIRLQWWRECLDGIYDGAARQHEVVQPLAEAIAARQLPPALLEAIIDARELALDADQIGRAQCRDRVLQARENAVVHVSFKKKKTMR